MFTWGWGTAVLLALALITSSGISACIVPKVDELFVKVGYRWVGLKYSWAEGPEWFKLTPTDSSNYYFFKWGAILSLKNFGCLISIYVKSTRPVFIWSRSPVTSRSVILSQTYFKCKRLSVILLRISLCIRFFFCANASLDSMRKLKFVGLKLY